LTGRSFHEQGANASWGRPAYDRIRKTARTIADLAGAEKIATDPVSEAIEYRSLDRQMWK